MRPTTDSAEASQDGEPFVPGEAWLDAFEAQTHAELIARARRCATKHARWIAKAGAQVDPMDLVMGALDATRAGVLRWHPAGCSLETHVLWAIGSRARHLRERALRLPHRPIDPDQSTDADVEAALDRAREREDAEASAFACETFAIARELAQSDTDVLALLDAYQAGALTRQDVIAVTRWPKNRYRNVRLRLDRLVERMGVDSGSSVRARA